MSSPALTKTRIALGVLMATATIATTGVATTLALTRTPTTENNTDRSSAANTAGDKRRSTTTQGFAPTRQATPTTRPSHTQTKGS